MTRGSTAGSMRVDLLGPVEVTVDGGSRPVRGLRRRTVLAVLALPPGEVVSIDRLLETGWGATAPAAGAVTLQSHVSHLRRELGPAAPIRAYPPGYVLELGADGTDVQTADRLIELGRHSPDPARGVRLLQEAIGLWRGAPLANIAESAWASDQVARLDGLLLRAQRGLIDHRLALGEHADLIPELERLSRQYPFDEPLFGQLMLALYRYGRQADALAVFQRLRDHLRDELGVSPGAALRELHQAVLRHDPAIDLAAPDLTVTGPSAVSVLPGPGPAQLPAAIVSFSGRARELDALTGLLTEAAAPADRTQVPRIVVVSGTAGVGKTALAVHWAHQVAAQFPDGQLYVNLRGFDPSRSPTRPTDAVRGFLDALGVEAGRIPTELDAQTGLYRSLLAGRRVLVILDNARDAEQVRQLLPGAPGCLVVVTSRDQLAGLIATEDAASLMLELLPADEARQLVIQRVGAGRAAAEPEAVDRIIEACARLPLAIAVATAHASIRPRLPLATLADELTAAPLDAFRSGDPVSDVRKVLSWSYQALEPATARVFRQLGLHPGPDVAGPAVASLAGVTVAQARTALAELTQAHLLTEHPPGRYGFHDLLRAYAGELAETDESGPARSAATRRLLDHYLHSAHAAASVRFGPWIQLDLPEPAPGVCVEQPSDEKSAMAWLSAEHRVLLAAIDQAAATGHDGHPWRLAWVLSSYLRQQHLLLEWAATQRIALDSARRAADHVGLAHAHQGLGRAYTWLGRLDEAEQELARALEWFSRLADQTSLGQVHLNIGGLWHQRRDYTQALHHATEALTFFRAAGHRTGEAEALSGMGWCYTQLGDHHRAMDYCRQALRMHEEAGDRLAQAATWDSLGYVHHGLSDYPQAIDCYTMAVDIFRDLGDRYNEADTLSRLGDTQAARGAAPAARDAWQRALDILDDLGHPDAPRLRERLAAG